MLFAETETEYEEVMKGSSHKDAASVGYNQSGRMFAFPSIEHNDLVISQTPVICKYLATKLDNGRLVIFTFYFTYMNIKTVNFQCWK